MLSSHIVKCEVQVELNHKKVLVIRYTFYFQFNQSCTLTSILSNSVNDTLKHGSTCYCLFDLQFCYHLADKL
jgi:hypothetical protein